MKLSDTKLVILHAAAQRDDGIALPLPAGLKGQAAFKVVHSMIDKGLIEEVEPQHAGITLKRNDPVWSNSADGRITTLIITDAGLAAIGIEPDEPKNETDVDTATPAADGADRDASATNIAMAATAMPNAPAATPVDANTRTPREGTKQAKLIEMLRTDTGVTIDEIAAATGWRRHTIRGAMSSALKKKLGLEITSEKIEGRGRVYSLG